MKTKPSILLPGGSLSTEFLVLLLAAAWLLAWRAILGATWGLAPGLSAEGIDPGILYNADDTWSYLSWVQQYRHGNGLAGLLYTTEPHAASLWLFPLWLVGEISALTGLPPAGIYNISGIVGALLAVFFFRRAATTLGLPSSARDWATLALLVGNGGSWMWYLLKKLGLCASSDSAELFFLDLFPSTAFITYAYHAIGLGLLAALWWQASELSARRRDNCPCMGPLLATAGLAFFLAFSRPYEPIAFLGAWSLKTVWHGLRRKKDPRAWRASLGVAFLLGASLGPGVGWTIWVATRPIWSTFAGESLALGMELGHGAWFFSLGGWLVLAVIGGFAAWRADPLRAALPITASLLFFGILLLLGSGRAKLASGLALGPLLLAGWGCVSLVSVATRAPRGMRVVLAGLGLFALLGLPSLIMNLLAIALRTPPKVPEGLWSLAAVLPVSPNRPPCVLVSLEAGAILPGLVGARVWVGHFSLTHRYREKIARLRAAGLDPAYPPADPVAAESALDAIIDEASFTCALLEENLSAPLRRLAVRGWTPLSSAGGWILLRAPVPPAP